MIECKGEVRWCTGDKKHTTISHLRGCDCDDGSHSDNAKEVEEGHSRQRMEGGQQRCWWRTAAGDGGR